MNQLINGRAMPMAARLRAERPQRRVGPALGAAAAALGALAVTNHLLARRSERRHPPRGRFLTVDGVRLHYLERGEGPPVVLIHGNGVTAEDFELSGLLGRLARDHRVIAFDRPGFGYSERPRDRVWTAQAQAKLLLDALTALDADVAVLVAHSWGTLVAMEAALQRPDRVRALVLMSGYYWPTPRLDVPLLSGPAVPGVGDVLRFTVSPPLGRLMTPMVMKQIFSPSRVPAHFKEGFDTSLALRPSQLRATAGDTALMPLEAAKTAKRHRELRSPVLLISGDGDKIVSFEHQSRRLARELLGGQIKIIRGAGHMVHHTARDEVAASIETFFRELRAVTPAGADLDQEIAEAKPAGGEAWERESEVRPL